jgi:DNA-binding response OmpR family regulator
MNKPMPIFYQTVLIVEDEPDTAEMLAEMMRLSGYQVINAFGGAHALSLISKEKPDVVILDLMMPDLSGQEVLRFMRRDPRLEGIPVVIVSARSTQSDIVEGLSAGASAYLTKPVGFKDLREAVEGAVRSARS